MIAFTISEHIATEVLVIFRWSSDSNLTPINDTNQTSHAKLGVEPLRKVLMMFSFTLPSAYLPFFRFGNLKNGSWEFYKFTHKVIVYKEDNFFYDS